MAYTRYSIYAVARKNLSRFHIVTILHNTSHFMLNCHG